MSELIKNENDFINKLADITGTTDINFGLISEESKNNIEKLDAELNEYLKTNTDFDNYTEEQKDKLFDDAIIKWNEIKDAIKNANCVFNVTGLELKVIDKKLHQNIDYTAETLFYGLHLKKNFLNDLPKINEDFKSVTIDITFSQSIALYHVLSSLVVRGLNKENYAYAHVLYTLAEISKVYQHYDAMSARLGQAINQWNLGLTSEDAKKLEKEIAMQVAKDAISEAE